MRRPRHRRTRAVEALVEVELHDLVFRVGLAQLVCERELPELSGDRLVGGQELLLGELLGDGARATDDVPRTEVVVCGPDDGRDVETRVGVEAPVLDGDGRLDHHRRDCVQLDREPVVSVVAHIGEKNAFLVGDDRVAREDGAVEALDRRQAIDERLGVGVAGQADHHQQDEDNAE